MTRLKEMKALATEEAVKLKQHSTMAERKRLNLNTVNPENPERCIYGQMTGDCNSQRALNLILLCATRVYETEGYSGDDMPLIAPLNGAPTKVERKDPRAFTYQSPIELLIYGENGGRDAQAKLIAFLQDETQTLSL